MQAFYMDFKCSLAIYSKGDYIRESIKNIEK